MNSLHSKTAREQGGFTELAYNGQNERAEWGLALGSGSELNDRHHKGELYPIVQDHQALLLMVWGGLRLIVTIILKVAIILRYRGCVLWILAAFWGTLFQLALFPINWD